MAEDNLEWEEWNPEEISFVDHMVAGSFAGLAEHVSIFPIDTLKTHMQCERCLQGSRPMQTLTCAANLIRDKGVFRLWRGVSATFSGCIPAHAAYFSIFESMKVLSGADQGGHRPVQAALCGASAALGHDLFMTPFDTIKQRMQLGHYSSLLQCLRSTPLRSLYASLPTTLVMNMPYGMLMVAANESARNVLNPTHAPRLDLSMLAGAIAGATAALLTTPLDVVKTRLQTQDLRPCPSAAGEAPTSLPSQRYSTAMSVVRHVLAEEGPAGLLRGAGLRMLVHAPSVAISWTAYDLAKRALSYKSSLLGQHRHL